MSKIISQGKKMLATSESRNALVRALRLSSPFKERLISRLLSVIADGWEQECGSKEYRDGSSGRNGTGSEKMPRQMA